MSTPKRFAVISSILFSKLKSVQSIFHVATFKLESIAIEVSERKQTGTTTLKADRFKDEYKKASVGRPR